MLVMGAYPARLTSHQLQWTDSPLPAVLRSDWALCTRGSWRRTIAEGLAHRRLRRCRAKRILSVAKLHLP